MIVHENGHWRSIYTPDEKKEVAIEAVSELSPEERAAYQVLMKEYDLEGHFPTTNLIADAEWDETPVPIREWLKDPELVGETGETLYPKLKEDMIELFEGGYSEAIFTGAIGWGKDYLATTCVMRVLYELMCMKNPQRSLGLGAGEPIHIAPISHRKDAAKRVVFGGVCKKLNLSPFFRGRFVETQEEVRFPEKGIYIVGGASSDAAVLGLNVICAIIDETNFMGAGKVHTGSASGEAYDKAAMIYNALARRVKSRYRRNGVKGLILLVSSKRATDDFTERRIKEARDSEDSEIRRSVFVRDYATWHVNPGPFEHQKWYRATISPTEGRCRVLQDGEEPPADGITFDFPEDTLEEFVKDPEGAARDIAGIATDAVRPFFSRRRMIEDMMEPDRVHPFGTHEWRSDKALDIKWEYLVQRNAKGEYVPACCPGAKRHVALDLSANQCATGFAVAHQCGMMEVWRYDTENKQRKMEEAPVIHFDAVLKIIAPDGGEIQHEHIRSLIYRLMERGIPIRSVTLDQWAYTPNAQLLRQHGLKVPKPLSVTRDLIPFLAARTALYEGRVKSAVYAHLRHELYKLQTSDDGKKVVKPRGVGKDLADAWAGAIYYISENATSGMPLAPQRGMHDTTGPAPGNQARWSNGEPTWWDDQSSKKDEGGGYTCIIM